MCGRELYDDFEEINPEAINQLQGSLNYARFPAQSVAHLEVQSSRGLIGAQPGQAEGLLSDQSGQTKGTSSSRSSHRQLGEGSHLVQSPAASAVQTSSGDLRGVQSDHTEGGFFNRSSHLQSGEGSHPHELRYRQADFKLDWGSPAPTPDDTMWLFPVFQYNRYGTKALPVSVQRDMSDEELFTALKNGYLKLSNRFQRFLSLRSVKKICFVKVEWSQHDS